MSIRNAIERLAVADALRFEIHTAAMLRKALDVCTDPQVRLVLQEIIAEEEEHLQSLDELLPPDTDRTRCAPAEETRKAPPLPRGPVCDILRAVLKREEASVTFYALLAERTPVPAIRRIFEQTAQSERGHVAKLAEHVHRVCDQSNAKGA